MARDDDARPLEPDRIDGVAHPRETTALLGHGDAEAAFLEAWGAGRAHHAWLLSGPRGVGKASFAYRVARFLLTRPTPEETGGLFGAPPPAEPDAASLAPPSLAPPSLASPADHPALARIAAGAHPGLIELRRPWDEKAKRFKREISVDQVRRLIEFFQLSAADGGWRVAIIDPADELNTAAANALLKALEEPPAKAMFLLVTHAAGRLPATVLSRCRRVGFRPLALEDCAAALRAACPELGATEAETLAALADGSPGEALTLWSMGGAGLYGEVLALLSDLPRIDRDRLAAFTQSVSGRENAEKFPAAGRLLRLAAERLARAGVSGPPSVQAAPGEAAILARLAPDARAGRIWAEISAGLADRFGAAVGLNLDPGRTLIETALYLEATARRKL